MAVSYLGGGNLSGLSSDIKPVTNIPAGTSFLETDTQLLYLFNGTSWIPVTEANVRDVFARELLSEILTQMKITNAYLASMNNGEIKTYDVD